MRFHFRSFVWGLYPCLHEGVPLLERDPFPLPLSEKQHHVAHEHDGRCSHDGGEQKGGFMPCIWLVESRPFWSKFAVAAG